MNRTQIQTEINRINRILRSNEIDDEARDNYEIRLDRLETDLAKLDDFLDDERMERILGC